MTKDWTLQDIVDLQRAFQQRLATDPELPHYPRTRTGQLVANAVLAISEAEELLHALPFKWHKRDYLRELTQLELDHVAEEATDLFIFAINALVLLDLDAQDIVALVRAKHAVNVERQDGGY